MNLTDNSKQAVTVLILPYIANLFSFTSEYSCKNKNKLNYT